MGRFIFIIALLFAAYNSNGQTYTKEYVKSFPLLKGLSIIGHYDLFKHRVKMTKEEALNYVVNGDTTKLYCPELEYDGWEEKIYGMTVSEYMPAKFVRVDYDNYYLLCYEVTECDNNGVRHKRLIILEIIDRQYVKRDSIAVEKSDEWEDYIMSLYNPQTQKLYLYNMSEHGGKWWSVLYRINPKTLKFEELRRFDGKVNAKLDKQIEALGWGDLFYSDDCE
ncbi:MAG: hypothetical protein E7069_12690 [Bacteroidales bacterium]|jgi:hypothetical protein|nr:hypothetical protein [Bacteroidales bacterium]